MKKYELYILKIRTSKYKTIKKIVKKRKGVWLNESPNVKSHFICNLECKDGHSFSLHNASILNTMTWCPVCKPDSSKGEEICRAILESLLNVKFVKTRRIEGLKSSQGVALEIDGFSEELKIGFEYQGKQHYELGTFINKNKKEFEDRKKRDLRKRKFFKDKKWVLLEIKYFKTFNLTNCIDQIKKYLDSVGIEYSDINVIKLKEYCQSIIGLNLKSKIYKLAKQCRSASEFKLLYRKFYTIAREQDLIPILFPKKKVKYVRNQKWTVDELKQLANKYTRKSDFFVYELKAYKYARKHKLLDLIFKNKT